jgi:hypothetical protein
MKKTIKVGLIVLGSLVLLVLVYMLINLVDAGPARLEGEDNLDLSSFEAYCLGVVGTPSFDKSNGYYRLWTLTEPFDVDIESDEVLLKYRRMHDPQFDMDKYRKEWLANPNAWVAGKAKEYKGFYEPYMRKRREIVKKHQDFDSPHHGEGTRDWTRRILKNKESVLELISMYRVFLERYQKLVDSDMFKDFTFISYDTTFPHLLAWLDVAKLYNTVQMLDALEGNWESSVSHILDHVELGKKMIKTGRSLIFNLVAKAVMKEALNSLAALMNEPEFPKSLYKTIADRLPPIGRDEFGTRIPLLLEGFFFCHQVEEGGLLLQKNRTQQYFCDFLSKLVNSEKIPPYKWGSTPLEMKVKNGMFWWLQNPRGKSIFEDFLKRKGMKNLFTTVFKAYSLKAVYDMTRISAELHRAYQPGKPVEEILQGLDTYRSWVDPCTGKPYKWNSQKQFLYSFGTDRDDDGGKVDHNSMDTDIILPVVLYIRNDN